MIFKFTPVKFWKSKKTFSIKNNNLIELMMYMARTSFRKKDLPGEHTKPPQITPKYPKPFYLFTVSHQTTYFIYFSL